MKRLALIALLALAPLLQGCNTMEGMGQDIQKGGEKIEDAADSNK
jgi:predicted small secreted protein